MGYTTDFSGAFTVCKKNRKIVPCALDKETKEFLTKFNQTRRMARNVDPKYGTEGEFYVEGTGMMGQDCDKTVIDGNRPPSTQPGLWCGWTPSNDGKSIEWDGGEKFYNYIEWIQYLIDKILAPKGYYLNGNVDWIGEDSDDRGTISIENNRVSAESEPEYRDIVDALLREKKLLPTLLGVHNTLDRLIGRALEK